ncbi:MAG: hypothetical protein MJ252_19485 [archaeon]|nr:hypothetical protein [archaeon]
MDSKDQSLKNKIQNSEAKESVITKYFGEEFFNKLVENVPKILDKYKKDPTILNVKDKNQDEDNKEPKEKSKIEEGKNKTEEKKKEENKKESPKKEENKKESPKEEDKKNIKEKEEEFSEEEEYNEEEQTEMKRKLSQLVQELKNSDEFVRVPAGSLKIFSEGMEALRKKK